jgi:large subunit ribosomal protein L22
MDTKYSFNQKSENIAFASIKDINANFKDLIAVCDSIRYKSLSLALESLDSVINDKKPILYRKYNKYMGARHELGGKKGRTPIKCAKIVRKVLINAMANADNKGMDVDSLYVVHASANKGIIARRGPPKGALFAGGANPSARHSDLEFAKVEIGLSTLENETLAPSLKSKIVFTMKKANIEHKRRIGEKGKKEEVIKEKKQKKEKKKIIEKVAEMPQNAIEKKDEQNKIEKVENEKTTIAKVENVENNKNNVAMKESKSKNSETKSVN